MRQILYRGKRIDDSKWAEGYFYKIWNKTFILWGMTNDSPNMEEVISETVGQYTGLKDKNGKEVYEGDIVCTRFPEGCENAGKMCSIGDIQFRDGMFGINWTQWKNDTFWGLRRIDEDFHKEIEVIGNIYDNPELLEVGV